MGVSEGGASGKTFRERGEGALERGVGPRGGCCAEATAAERPIAASAELMANVGRRKPRLLAGYPRPATSCGDQPGGMRFRPLPTTYRLDDSNRQRRARTSRAYQCGWGP